MTLAETRALFDMISYTAKTPAEYTRFMNALIALLYDIELRAS